LPTDLVWNSGGGFAPGCASNDTDFIKAVLADLASRFAFDKRRAYLVGMSNGGMLAYQAAALAADRFAAMASVAGTMTVPSWTPATPMPVLHIHGTKDPIVLFQGGGPIFDFLSVTDNMDRVARQNGITASPRATPLTPIDPTDLPVTRFDY